MNTEEELDQAMEDYKSCSNGFERARSWQSTFLQTNSWSLFYLVPKIYFTLVKNPIWCLYMCCYLFLLLIYLIQHSVSIIYSYQCQESYNSSFVVIIHVSRSKRVFFCSASSLWACMIFEIPCSFKYNWQMILCMKMLINI